MIREYLHFIRRCWPLLVFGMLTVFWGNFGQSFFISWFGASFQESLNLSATSYGTAYSMATLASGLLLMWLGGTIDKVPLRWFVTFSAFGLLVACLFVWQINSLVGLVFGLFLLRFFGQGLLPHTAITSMVRKFSVNRGKAVSVATIGVPVGEVILPFIAVLIIATFGWQKSWLVIGLTVPLLYLPLAHFLLKLSKNEKYTEDICVDADTCIKSVVVEPGCRRTLLRDYNFWLALPTILAAPFIITGVFIHQGFFLPQMGWTPMLFASCFVLYGASHWLSSMYTGAMVDRFSGVQLFRFIPFPMLLGLLICSITTGEWVAYMLMLLLGVSVGASSPIVNALWAEVYGTKNLGSIRALITSLSVISTSVSPIMFGFLIDWGITGHSLFLCLFSYVLVAVTLAYFAFSGKKSAKAEAV